MNIDEKTKQKIIGVIKAVLPNAQIYLFGSFATGLARLGSDIDIALDTGNKIKILDLAEIKDMLNASNIPQKFDVIDLNHINDEFKKQITKEMILWSN